MAIQILLMMNRATTLLCALFLGILTSNAQAYQWAKSMGGSNTDQGYSIALDGAGNVYTTGSFLGTVDFDPGAGTNNLTSVGPGGDIFISKLDEAGNFLWATRLGGTYSNLGNSIAVDGSGNVYSTGYFEGTADFDPGAGTSILTSAGQGGDIFIEKLDAAGNFIWAKSMGGPSWDHGHSIFVDDSGNVYTTGTFGETADFDPGPGTSTLTSGGISDIFISKLDAAGNFLWAKSMGGTDGERGSSIAVDGSGNVYITGFFGGTVDFDPGVGTSNLTSEGASDIFISKLDAAGNFSWAKRMGGPFSDAGTSVALDGSGDVYTTGSFAGTVDFDPGTGTSILTSEGVTDVFISKLDAEGNFGWVKRMGGPDQDGGNSIAVDGSGKVYTTGYFQGTADFDPEAGTSILTSAGAFDIFISELDAAGNFGWARSMGSTADDSGHSIAVDGSGNVHTTGSFRETVDFDPGAGTSNLTSDGNKDIFISKLNECISATGSDMVTACDSYLWIDGITYTESNNAAIHSIDGGAANGCDSIVTLDLTINRISDLTTSVSGVTISANNTDASYQWIDCDNNNSLIDGETGQSFSATSNGNYAVILTENGCVDTTDCVAISTVGILEPRFGDALSVYPNPTTGALSIDLGKSHNEVVITIRDQLGQDVLKRSYSGSNVFQMNMTGEAGMYFMEVNSGDNKAMLKVVKE